MKPKRKRAGTAGKAQVTQFDMPRGTDSSSERIFIEGPTVTAPRPEYRNVRRGDVTASLESRYRARAAKKKKRGNR